MADVITDKKGNPEPDVELRDYENVPLGEDIKTYFTREVLPHAPDAWISEDKKYCDHKDGKIGKVGYEISFTRYFYEYKPLRPLEEICGEIKKLGDEIAKMLTEKHNALIKHTVTKGLNPKAKTKASGIDWLGEIPENWKIMPIWMLFFIGRGRVISNEEILDNAGEYPVYSSQTENDGNLGGLATYDFEGDYITWTTDGANAGTVFNRTGKFNCTNVCGTLKSKRNKEIDLRFFTHALNVCTKIFVRYDINPKLMNNVIAGIRIQVPPVEEQRAICDFIDRETLKIDEMIEKVEKQIEKLKEYRQALITSAVTGKIKVGV